MCVGAAEAAAGAAAGSVAAVTLAGGLAADGLAEGGLAAVGLGGLSDNLNAVQCVRFFCSIVLQTEPCPVRRVHGEVKNAGDGPTDCRKDRRIVANSRFGGKRT